MEQDLAADLTQDQNAALGDVRSAAQTESHKIVQSASWGIPPREVFDRFEAQHRKPFGGSSGPLTEDKRFQL